MSDFTVELKGLKAQLDGIQTEMHGRADLWKESKAKAEELEQKMNELGQSVQTLMDRKDLGNAVADKTISPEDLKAFQQFCTKGVAQELNGPSGGYLVVPSMANQIIELQTDMDEFRPYARTMTVGTNMLQVPIETSKPTTQWVGENEQRDDTDNVGVGLANIPVNTVQCTVPISRDLIADGAVVNFESYVMGKLSEALAKAEGAAFVNGNGFKRPEGLFACSEIPEATATAHYNSITADEVIELWEYTTQATDKNAAYYMNKGTMAAIRKLKASGSGEYLWQSPIAQGAPATFNGFPVRILTSAPGLKTAGNHPIAFGDLFNTYTIVDRMDIDILRDEISKKRYNEIELTVNKRVGGGVVQPESMVFMKLGTTA